MLWPASYASIPITQKEILAVVLACAVWGLMWKNMRVLVHCDNEAAVAVLNSGYSRDSHIMQLLRSLFFVKSLLGFSLHVVHIRGELNVIADAISRGNLSLLFSQVPAASRVPSGISPNLQSLLVLQLPDWTSALWSQLFSSCFLLD